MPSSLFSHIRNPRPLPSVTCIMRSACLLLLGAACAFSQPFSFGIKGGVPFTDFLSTAESGRLVYTSVPNRYIVGAAAELRLPFGLGIELDALYRHLNYASNPGTTGVTVVSSRTTGNAWEFPLLAKYRFPGGIVRPYIEGGVAWDTLQGLKQTIDSGRLGTSSTSAPAELNKSTTTGFVIGAGLDIKALVIHFTPELRYTRWGARHFLDPNGLLSSNQNQAEFLVGIVF
jgi:opacity protein-like surface antigen